MDSYLMMLYVTFEQESALKFFFIEQGWAFCKPDLSVTTDKLGPTTSLLPVVGEETEVVGGEREPIQKIKVKIPAMKSSTKQKGKRKSIKQTGRSTKQNKRMSGSLGTEPNVTDVIMDMDDVQTIHSEGAIATALNASFTQDVQNINSRSAIDPDLNLNTPFTVQFEDGNEMQIKVENVVEDNEAAVDDDSDDNGDDEIDTDIDNSYEGAMENDMDVKSRVKFQDESGAKDNNCVAPKIIEAVVISQKPIFKCEICGKVVNSRSSLRKHKLRHGEKRILCNICSRGFYRMDEFRNHVKHIHEGTSNLEAVEVQKPIFTCEICGKVVNSKSSLRKHKLRHGEKRIPCTYCNRSFYRTDELKQHVKYLHDQISTDIFICDACGKSFKSRSTLLYHVSVKHSAEPREDMKCTICSRILSSKRKRLLHEKTHTIEGRGRKKCGLCNKLFANLEQHVKKCSSTCQLNMYGCSICENEYLDGQDLVDHVQYEHGT